MDPRGSIPHSEGLSKNLNHNLNKPISSHDTYFFKTCPNIVPPSTPSLPRGLFPIGSLIKILIPLLFCSILDTQSAHLKFNSCLYALLLEQVIWALSLLHLSLQLRLHSLGL